MSSRARQSASLLVSAGLLVLLPAGLLGQTLQQRKPSAGGRPVTSNDAGPASTGSARDALPLAAEGEYRWGESGEVIELYVEGGTLHGYLTRRSERRDAGSAPMTFRFTEASLAGGQLHFATSHIHGDWYAFTGRVVRGPAGTPREDGYYLLTGTLTIHLDAPERAPESTPGTAGGNVPGPAAGPDSADSTGTPAAGTVNRQVSLKLTGTSHAATTA